MVRTLIAIPCMDHIDVDFAQSLVQIQAVGEAQIAFLPGSLVYVAREKLAEVAINMKADYVLWLDSDMIFNPSILADLMADNKDFVSGLCFRRRTPFTPVIYSKIRYGIEPDDYESEEYLDYPMNSLFEVDACGFGGVLMKTEVIKAVQENFGRTFEPMRGFGEDISFCIRAKQLGYKIWCDSRVKMGHVTRSISSEDTYLAIKNRGGQNAI